MNSSVGFEILVIAHAFFTWFMTGVIWTVQLAIYPLFNRIPASSFASYEASYTRAITFVVGPGMIGETASALALFLVWRHNESWPGLLFLAIIWLSTFFIQVPLHNRLLNEFSTHDYRALVRSNWIRTVGWTCRAFIAFELLLLKSA